LATFRCAITEFSSFSSISFVGAASASSSGPSSGEPTPVADLGFFFFSSLARFPRSSGVNAVVRLM